MFTEDKSRIYFLSPDRVRVSSLHTEGLKEKAIDVFGVELSKEDVEQVLLGETDLALAGAARQPPAVTQRLQGKQRPFTLLQQWLKQTLVHAPLTPGSQGKAAKEYKVMLEADSEYVIDMWSPTIYSDLILKDPGGKEITRDENKDLNRNARIRYLCPTAGEYTVVATTRKGPPASLN
jgi:hypothetical protein